MKITSMLEGVYQEWRRVLVAIVSILVLWIVIFHESRPPPIIEQPAPRKTENREVWIEYSGFWGNPPVDGAWFRWNYRPNRYAPSSDPPGRVACRLFPQLGLYSSHDPAVIRKHFSDLSAAGVDAVLLQWYPPNRVDERDTADSANFTERTLELMLDIAPEFNLKVGVQIPTYFRQSNQTLFEDIQHFCETFSSREALLRVDGSPVIVIYDPHTIKGLPITIENLTETYGRIYFIANVLDRRHIAARLEDGFSAVFSYFASEGQSFCSTMKEWKGLVRDSRERGILFFPTVGPGYDDAPSNPWNAKAKRSRDSGSYYAKMWEGAVKAKPKTIVINSFNDFREGTNIEQSVERKGFDFTDETWTGVGGNPNDFIDRTREWIGYFKGFLPKPVI